MPRAHRTTVTVVLLLTAACLAQFLVGEARGTEPDYTFPRDKALRYRYKSFFNCSFKAKGGKTKVSKTGDSLFEYIGEGRSVRVQIREFKAKISAPPDVIVFDSRKTYSAKQADANPLVAVLSQVPGESYFLQIGSLGAVDRVYGFSEVFARAMSRAITGTNVMSKKLSNSFGQVFSEDDMRVGMGLIIPEFPETVQKGMTFERQVKVNAEGIVLTFEMHYRVTSCKNKLACSISGPLHMSVGGEVSPKDGTVKGSAVFDLNKKRLLFSSVKGYLKLPNLSITQSYELKLEKELPLAEVGPLSFEKPLRSILKLVERRVVKAATRRTPVPVYSSSDGDEVALLLCRGDVVRVVGKADGEQGARLRIVTWLGREGWIDEKATGPYDPGAKGGEEDD